MGIGETGSHEHSDEGGTRPSRCTRVFSPENSTNSYYNAAVILKRSRLHLSGGLEGLGVAWPPSFPFSQVVMDYVNLLLRPILVGAPIARPLIDIRAVSGAISTNIQAQATVLVHQRVVVAIGSPRPSLVGAAITCPLIHVRASGFGCGRHIQTQTAVLANDCEIAIVQIVELPALPRVAVAGIKIDVGAWLSVWLLNIHTLTALLPNNLHSVATTTAGCITN